MATTTTKARALTLIANFIVKDELFEWIRTGDDACPACIKWSTIGPQTMEFWEVNAIPGTKGDYLYGDYGTYCEDNCQCYLKPILIG